MLEITITVKDAHGVVSEISHSVANLDDKDIIGSVENAVTKFRTETLPIVSAQLVEHQQTLFEGEKNTEEERE